MNINFKKKIYSFLSIFLVLVLFFTSTGNVLALATQVDLLTAGNYAVLAGSGITNTGATTIDGGDVGSSPTSTETGFAGNVTITNGANHTSADPNDAATVQAKADLFTAYTQAAAEVSDATITGNLAGQTYTPGVYSSGSLNIATNGTVTLDAQGNSNAIWVFQTGSTIVANTGSSVSLINGANACNVFWKNASAVTLGANVNFSGNILSHDDITLLDSVTFTGRLLAGAQGPTGAGAITLQHDTISNPCGNTPTPTATPTPTPSSNSTSNSTSNSGGSGISGCNSTPITAMPRIVSTKRISPTSFLISWDPYQGLDTFSIRYGFINGQFLYNTKVKGFSTTINDLPPNKPIWVEVAATDNCAIGQYSSAVLAGNPILPSAGVNPGPNYLKNITNFFHVIAGWI